MIVEAGSSWGKVTVAFLAFAGKTPVSGDGRADLARSVDYRLKLWSGGRPLISLARELEILLSKYRGSVAEIAGVAPSLGGRIVAQAVRGSRPQRESRFASGGDVGRR